MCITLPVELASFFVPSSHSLSSWFISSCTHHLITVPIFALTIDHSLGILLKTPLHLPTALARLLSPDPTMLQCELCRWLVAAASDAERVGLCGDGCGGNVSIGGLGAGRIAYSLEGCGLQNLTCGLFSLKPRCDNSAVNF